MNNSANKRSVWLGRYFKGWAYLCLIFGSILGTGYFVWGFIAGNPIPINGVDSNDIIDKSLAVAFPLLIAAAGWLTLRFLHSKEQQTGG